MIPGFCLDDQPEAEELVKRIRGLEAELNEMTAKWATECIGRKASNAERDRYRTCLIDLQQSHLIGVTANDKINKALRGE